MPSENNQSQNTKAQQQQNDNSDNYNEVNVRSRQFQTWEEYCKMRFYEFKAQSILMDNFQLLFLKQYDKLLTPDEKRVRDRQDTVVMATSTMANLGSFGFIMSQLSFLQQEARFNPFRDIKVFIAGVSFMFLMRGLGAMYMWSNVEPIYFRIEKNINFSQNVDFYANNTMNLTKIFFYRNFF